MSVLSLTADAVTSVKDDALYPNMGSVLITCVVGIVIVFAVLAIIYLAMVVMSSILSDKGGKKVTVVSPYACTVQSLGGKTAVSENDVAATVVTDSGAVEEILVPVSGTISYCVSDGAKVKKGQKLFVIK